MLSSYKILDQPLTSLGAGKILINTINAYSYVMSTKDAAFAEALRQCEVLIPDGVGAVWGKRFLDGQKLKKIAGEDLFFYEMGRLEELGSTKHEARSKEEDGRPVTDAGFCQETGFREQNAVLTDEGASVKEDKMKTEARSTKTEDGNTDYKPKVFFLGSMESTLAKMKERAAKEFPHVEVHTYSPPYKPVFSAEDNAAMIGAVNAVKPDVLFVGMTAPKQEKWAYEHYHELETGHIGCIGAVFDFYAGTVKRAPQWMISIGLEWFYRLSSEPKRLWKRYILGNAEFIFLILKEKVQLTFRSK